MLNKKLLTAAVTTALLGGVGATSVQAFEVSGNVALVSDYRFRGISQTGEDAAIQGGFDASFDPGFYIGTWASSVDFGDLPPGAGSYGTMEIDYYAGWSSAIGDTDFAIDVGTMYYQYPGDTTNPDGDYAEFYVKPSWKDFTLGATYSDDYYAETGKFWYFSGDYSHTLVENLSLGLHVGYNDFDESSFFGDSDEDSYTDWSVTLGYNFRGVDLAVAYVDTDLNDEDCFGDSGLCGSTAVFSISKSL